MEDTALIGLYWQRDETAIEATATKYGGLCGSIARNILKAPEDCEECLNDTYFAVWNAIPEQRPSRFSVFVSRITRNLALKSGNICPPPSETPLRSSRWRSWETAFPGRTAWRTRWRTGASNGSLTRFFGSRAGRSGMFSSGGTGILTLSGAICEATGFSESKVKSMLLAMRRKLRDYLESEGVEI